MPSVPPLEAETPKPLPKPKPTKPSKAPEPEPAPEPTPSLATPLHVAAEAGDEARIQELLEGKKKWGRVLLLCVCMGTLFSWGPKRFFESSAFYACGKPMIGVSMEGGRFDFKPELDSEQN